MFDAGHRDRLPARRGRRRVRLDARRPAPPGGPWTPPAWTRSTSTCCSSPPPPGTWPSPPPRTSCRPNSARPGARAGRHQRLQQLRQRHRPGPVDDPRRAGPPGAGGHRRDPEPRDAPRLRTACAEARDALRRLHLRRRGRRRGGRAGRPRRDPRRGQPRPTREHWAGRRHLRRRLPASARRGAHLLPRRRAHDCAASSRRSGSALDGGARTAPAWSWDDYARVLVHQVTVPYLERFVEVTGVPRDKLEVTVAELGNMASATLGVQLARVCPGCCAGRPGAVRRPRRRRQHDDAWSGRCRDRRMWVVVPAHQRGRPGSAQPCGALAAQTDRDFTLLVVDNGSTDGTRGHRPRVRAGAPLPGAGADRSRRRASAAPWTPASGTRSRHGADMLARTDADCLPRPGWTGRRAGRAGTARARAWSAGGSPPAATSTARWAGPPSALLVALAALFGRLRPGAPRGHGYPGARTGCTRATTWPSPPRCTWPPAVCPGAPPRPTGRFLNRVRRHTTAIAHCRAMVVENSTRRLRAYGIVGTARWYLDQGSGTPRRGPPLMLDRLAHALRAATDRPAVLGCTRVRARPGSAPPAASWPTWPTAYAAALHARGLARRGHRRRRRTARAARAGRAARRVPAGAAGRRAGPDRRARTCCCARLALARPALVLADAAAQAVAGWARPLARRARLALPDLAALGPVATVGPRLPGCAPGAGPAGVAGGACPTARRRRRRRGDRVHLRHHLPAARRRAHPGRASRPGCARCADLVAPRARTGPCSAAPSSCWSRRWRGGAPVALPARTPPRSWPGSSARLRARRPPI